MSITKKNPYWSSWICFCSALVGQKFSHEIIDKQFKEIVDRNDWKGNHWDEIYSHLYHL